MTLRQSYTIHCFKVRIYKNTSILYGNICSNIFVKYIIGVQELILWRERVVENGFLIFHHCVIGFYSFYLYFICVCHYADLHDMGIREFSCCSQQVQDQVQRSSIIIELICLCVCVCVNCYPELRLTPHPMLLNACKYTFTLNLQYKGNRPIDQVKHIII